MLDSLRESRKVARYLKSFLKGGMVHTNLQPSFGCNYHCDICNFWKEDFQSMPRLSVVEIEVIAEKLSQVGPQIVSIGGGEPLEDEHIVETVRALARRHFPVMICNGWYVTPELSRELFRAGMYEISVSVDYAEPKKHDEQRGQAGAWERAIEALRILYANRTRPSQRVQMISVIMDDNVDEVEPLIRKCIELGITYMVTLYSHGRGKKELRKVPLCVSRHLLQMKRKYKQFVSLRGYVGRFAEAVQARGIGPCYAGQHLCNIDSRGNVSFCIDRLDAAVGNILSDNVHELFGKLRQASREDSCRACWTSCRGSIETLMYGGQRLGNIYDYYQMTKWMGLRAAA